jgi:hypothetical protein
MNVCPVSFLSPPASDVVPVDIVACDHGIILDNVSSPRASSVRDLDTERLLDAPRIPRRHAPCGYPPYCEYINVYNVVGPCEQWFYRPSWMRATLALYLIWTTTFAIASYYPSAHKVRPCLSSSHPTLPSHVSIAVQENNVVTRYEGLPPRHHSDDAQYWRDRDATRLIHRRFSFIVTITLVIVRLKIRLVNKRKQLEVEVEIVDVDVTALSSPICIPPWGSPSCINAFSNGPLIVRRSSLLVSDGSRYLYDTDFRVV